MQKHILCIDDDPSILVVRKLILESSGFKVYTSANGADGLRVFKSHSIDAVVLDYVMPEMDGAAVCEAIKEARPGTPVIMLSAHPSARNAVAHLIDAFISKGENPEVLISTLRSLLA